MNQQERIDFSIQIAADEVADAKARLLSKLDDVERDTRLVREALDAGRVPSDTNMRNANVEMARYMAAVAHHRTLSRLVAS